jgi:hypothetical protein
VEGRFRGLFVSESSSRLKLEAEVHLLDLAFRLAGTRDYNVTQTWTLPYVSGQRYVGKDVYILTSQRTFSIAEAFTYRIGDHCFAAMPMLHLDNPVTKTNWKGKGIAPDTRIVDKDALSTAHRVALRRQRCIEICGRFQEPPGNAGAGLLLHGTCPYGIY